jgi:heptosyltransferase I
MPRSPRDLRSLEPANVCIIKPSALGDVVHALPVLSALRRHWPRARISWVVNRGLTGLLEGNADLDEVIAFDRAAAGRFPMGLARSARFFAGLRSKRYDVAIDLQGLLRSGLMTAVTGAPVRIGLSDAREGSRHFYTNFAEMPAEPTHIVDRLLRVVELFGADASVARFPVSYAQGDDAWAARAIDSVASPRLIFNMGARWLTKRWPPEQFAEIGRRAIREWGAGLIVVGAPEDRALVEVFRRCIDPSLEFLDLCGATSLPRLAALAARSSLFLSNDTGPLHLAAAAGARVVGIYTCTDPRRTGPYGDKAVVAATKIWCAASRVKTCDRLECMCELTADRVWDAVKNALNSDYDPRPNAA